MRFLLFLALSFTYACNNNSKSDNFAEERKKKRELNISDGNRLDLKNDAIPLSDSVRYTYDLQKINRLSQPMSFTGRVIDVLEKDSSLILVVKIINRVSIVAKINADLSDYLKLKTVISEKYLHRIHFIVSVNQINSGTLLGMASETEEVDGYFDSYLYYEMDEPILMLSGKLIDYLILQ